MGTEACLVRMRCRLSPRRRLYTQRRTARTRARNGVVYAGRRDHGIGLQLMGTQPLRRSPWSSTNCSEARLPAWRDVIGKRARAPFSCSVGVGAPMLSIGEGRRDITLVARIVTGWLQAGRTLFACSSVGRPSQTDF